MAEITQAETRGGCCTAQAVWRAGWASGLEEVQEQADPLAGIPGMATFHCVPWKWETFMESKAISWDHRVTDDVDKDPCSEQDQLQQVSQGCVKSDF